MDQDGVLRFTEDELEDIDLLRAIYQLESARVSGPRSYETGLSDVAWTVDEVVDVADTDIGEEALEAFVEDLVDEDQAMRIPGDDADRFVTRVSETVRLVGHGYEYWERSRPGFEAVRWLVERKTIPDRTVSVEDVISTALEAVGDDLPPDVAGNLPRALEDALGGVTSTFGGPDEKVRFSEFQSRSITRLLSAQYGDVDVEPNQILCADVGGGKTAAFAIGALVSAVEATLSDDLERTHLLLYPRTALARDQFKEIEEMAGSIGFAQPDVHFEHYSYYDEGNQSVRDGVADTYASPSETPDLIVTTLETLKRRLHNPDFVDAVAPGLRRVILDEIHLVEGTTGTNVIRLLDRLRAISDRDILWTGASATIAQPDEHAAEVFGLEPDKVGVTRPGDEEVRDAGLVHHVFLKPTGQLSTLGLLTNTTSLILHNRRRAIGDRDQDGGRPKALGFADNLDLLGRWNSELQENERTEYQVRGRGHPKAADKNEWGAPEREVPYALRFRNPLTRRMQAASGQQANTEYGAKYEEVLQDAEVDDPCAACQRGERLTVGSVEPEELRELGRFVYRDPTKGSDYVGGFRIKNEAFEADEEETIGTLDRCPFMQAGACAWFPEEGFDTEGIPGSPFHEWKNVARSTIHSSKKKDEASELQDELEEIVFEASVEEVYDIFSDEDPRIPVDIVLASPSLEVGIDLENVTEEVMHRSIRNVASYRQKAGRAGREVGSDTLITTVLSQRPVDLHYYRQPRKLVRTGRLEPVPLKEHNRTLLKAGLYMAVWDFLALHHDLPEAIPRGVPDEGRSAFHTRIETILEELRTRREALQEHLVSFSRGQAGEEEIAGAVRQVEDELEALVRPAPSIYANPGITSAADVIANFIDRRGVELELSSSVQTGLRRLKDASDDLRRAKAKIHPRRYGMSEEVQRIDDMRHSGWDLEALREISNQLEKKKEEMDDADEEWDLGEYLHHLSGVQRTLKRIEREVGLEEIQLWQIRNQLQDQFASSFGRAHYLSYVIQDLPFFQHGKNERAYAFLPTLFKNPYEDAVEVQKNIQKGRREKTRYESVPVDEALHSLVPGSWTFRMGKEPFKAEPGFLDLKQGQVALARLDQMEETGHRFQILKGGIAGPPWNPGPFDLYLPTRIALQNYSKYESFERDSGRSPDEIHGDLHRDRSKRSKLPKSYQDRWIAAEWEDASSIGVLDLDLDSFEVQTDGEGGPSGQALREAIEHPMEDGLLADVEFLEELDIVEYIHGVNRSFGGDIPGLDIRYRDGDRSIGFGNEFRTDGVLITLDEELVSDIKAELEEALLHDPEWAPSALKAIRSLLRMGTGFRDQNLDPWTIRDLVRVASAAVLDTDSGNDEPTFQGLVDELRRLLDEPDELEHVARRLADAEEREPGSHRTPPGEEANGAEAEEVASRLVDRVLDGADQIEGHLDSLEDGVGRWVEMSLINTFGITAVQALQRLSGTPEEKIGYYPRLEVLNHGTYQVLLYDREMNGNGTCELLKEYTHVLHLQRLGSGGEDPLLPTEDYLTLLEQELLQCPQHHTDVDALARHVDEDGDGIPEFAYVEDHAEEVEEVSRDVWDALAVQGPGEGWRLPVLNTINAYVADEIGLAPDDVERATGICWNGCPECVLSDTMILGSLVGQDLVDKAVLDRWFEEGRSRSDAYRDLPTESLVQGDELTPIGAKTRVCRNLGGKTYRGVRLPFTIGASRSRAGEHGAGLLLRAGDIAGLDLLPDREQGEAWGVSVGMPQLSGYLLLMSAYLGSLGRIPQDRREVTMVFYDIRDVDLDEAAFSQTMLDALDSNRKEDYGGGEIRKLSDVLGWMASAGFDLTICVDSERARVDEVQEFLKTVQERSEGKATILTKDIYKGSMHAKSLITPMGAVSGSANMTFSGTRRNDEVDNYAEFGTSGYDELHQTLSDIIRDAADWSA